MHIEIRKRGGKKLYYLAYSFRDNGRVRKIRRYLGTDLTSKKIAETRKQAEKSITEQMGNYRKIRDPLHTVLSAEEMKAVKTMLTDSEMKISHLSDSQWEMFTELFTYDTNAIEGSTITVSEVREIIREDKWPPRRSKEEISETYGVAEAVDFIRKTKEHVSLELIKSLHRIVFKNSKAFAGEFRSKGIEVAVVDSKGGVIHKGAPQKQVARLLKELVKWYDRSKGKYHPIVLAAVVHNQFENVHPFQDGNGRVGRLLLNNILIKHGLPPVNIELQNRIEYYAALQAYENHGNLRPTIELILKEYMKMRKALNR
ncbi:MAG: Fic family protein [Candidatus Aenigmarchaeota archaeon]|nr:Fic family protein [Candidatus Aenigmarchaeota archaeon]